MINKRLLTAFVMALVALGLSACVSTMQMQTLLCSNTSPKKDVKIKYGDSHLSVDVKEKKVNRDDYLVFDLKPDMGNGPPPRNVDFKAQLVTISPKPAGGKTWPSASGSFDNSGGKLVICVPNDLPAPETYEYEISITEVGSLDPRVIVEP